MEEVKLFGFWASPFSRRVEIALKMKGIQYEYTEEDLSNKSSFLLKYNPIHKKVPVLVHNGKPIAESLVILEYIEDTWKDNPILPQDPHARALARFWAKFIDEECFLPLWKAFRSSGEDQQKAVEEAFGHLRFLEDELKDKKYFGGDRIGFVDIVANIIAFWMRVFQEVVGLELLTRENFPKVWEWAEMHVNSSIIKENLPPKDRLVVRFHHLLSASRALK